MTTAMTTSRPAPRPAGGRAALPEGAAKFSRAYLDDKNLPQKSLTPVPVDADERRTAHLLFQCPHMVPLNGGGKERCQTAEWMLPDAAGRFCALHGEKLAPPEKPPSQALATAKEAAKLHGGSAKPWLLPLSAAAADIALSAAGAGPVDTLLLAPAAVAGAYYVSKRRLTADAIANNRIEKGQKSGKRVARIKAQARRKAAVAAEAGVWASALVGTDLSTLPGLIVASAGMVRWGVGVAEWWAHAEERRTRGIAEAVAAANMPAVAPTPVEAPDPVQLRAVMTWKALIGNSGGPLAGTELVEFKRLPACEVGAATRSRMPNWTAKVQAVVAGSINMRESRPSLLGRIAAAYQCTYADVSFTADESDLSVGWLRIQPDNLLAETVMWTGPSASNWKAGISRIGRFDDGLDILYQWWNDTGACHDLISGCTGSGKSELVAQLLLASLHSNGLVLDWVGDPQGGQSYGALKSAVDWFARDKTEIKLMLLAAVKEMHRRNDELSAADIKTWVATKAMPLLVITLDEVQSYIEDPDILALVEMLVGQSRKCGIKMRLITQIPAAYNLGGSTYIKEQLKAGQSLIFRAMTDIAGRSAVDGDSVVDPTMLPTKWGKNTCAAGLTTAGLMFVQGLHGRDVFGRADYTGKDMKVWLADDAGGSTLTPGRFGPAAQRVSGVLWGDRQVRAAKLLAAGRSDADILPGGRAVELIEAAIELAGGEVPSKSTAVEAVPAQLKARDVVLAAARDLADNGQVGKPAIYDAVKDRMATGTCDKALTDLVADGSLRRIKNGVYGVTG